MLKYKYIFFSIKYAEAILSNRTRKLLWFEIGKVLIAVLENKFIVSFVINLDTLSLPMVIQFSASILKPFLKSLNSKAIIDIRLRFQSGAAPSCISLSICRGV